MAQNVTINGVDYNSVPSVKIPIKGSSPTSYAVFVDTSDADAVAGNILATKTAYVNGSKITGNIATKTSSDMTVSGKTVTAPAGYYASAQSKDVADGSVSVPATSITANPTITTSGGNITASVSASQSISPSVSAGYVSSGDAGTATVSGSASVSATSLDQYLLAGNIKNGVTIFGVQGTLALPSITQDSTTKVLTIS